MKWIWLLAGGMCGTGARYVLTTWMNVSVKGPFAVGTVVVNALGCLIIGFVSVLLVERFQQSESLRLFLMVGFLGAFTTFSSYIYETYQLVDQQAWFWASVNLFGSLALGLLAFMVGSRLGFMIGMK